MLNDSGFTIWFTGLPCSGKTTLADAIQDKLATAGFHAERLDGDIFRKNVSKNLGYSKEDRDLNVQKAALAARQINQDGKVALVSLISPYRASRRLARDTIHYFIEVYVRCPIEICERRDVKNMYHMARLGKINNFTGVSDPYQEPIDPEVIVDTSDMDVESCVDHIMKFLQHQYIVPLFSYDRGNS